MSGVWISDDRNRTWCCPVYSQISGRGDSHRGGGTGHANENWWGGGRNDKIGAPENGQVLEGIRVGHDKGRYGGGTKFQGNSSGGGNFDKVGTYSESKLTVKSADVGKIIGKGGWKVREFEEESGVHVQVHDT